MASWIDVGTFTFTGNKAMLLAMIHRSFRSHGPFELVLNDENGASISPETYWDDLSSVPVEALSAFIEDVVEDKVQHQLYDGEQPFAGPEAYWMARLDKSTIPLYIKFLMLNDMDHEIHQGWQINNVFSEHKLCEEVLMLMAARCGAISGQHGAESVGSFWREWNLDRELLQSDELRNVFTRSFFESTLVDTIYTAAHRLTMKEFTEQLSSNEVDVWEGTIHADQLGFMEDELLAMIKQDFKNMMLELLPHLDQGILGEGIFSAKITIPS